jgi:2'-5' RNA ligase
VGKAAADRGQPGPGAHRLFVALDLPPRTRGAITEWRDAALLGRDGLRPVAGRALHVTLAFLGWTPAARVDDVWDAARAAAAGRVAPLLSAGGVVGVPRRRPRLFALDLADEGGHAAHLSRAVADGLAGAGLHEPEDRAFWPHVTLARVPRSARAAPLGGPPATLEPFSATVLTLYRSDQSRSGARYTALKRLDLRAR